MIALHFLILQAAAGIVPGEVLSTNQLMEVCHWMRSHFHHFCVKKDIKFHHSIRQIHDCQKRSVPSYRLMIIP